MITIIAVVGWLLFLSTAVLYWVGNRLNSQESNSLAMFTLAVMLSDDFRAVVRAGFTRVIENSKGSSTQLVVYALIEGITENAKSCYKPNAEISTVSIVTDLVKKEI